jgi:hypothetical protein
MRYELIEEEAPKGRFEELDKPPGQWSGREAAAQVMMGLMRGGLPALGNQAITESNKMLDRAAYDLGGKATDALAGKVPPERAAQAGYATNILTQYLPGSLLGKGAELLGRPAMEGGAKWLMHSAVKPPLDMALKGKADPGIETMLKHGISPSKGGVEKLDDLIAPLRSKIDDLISDASSRGAMVDRNHVASALRSVLPKFEGAPEREIDAIVRAESEFLANQPRMIPIAEAQKLKENIGRWLKDSAYGTITTAEKESYKGLRRGLKEGIEGVSPQVKAPNAEMSKLLEARNLAERRAVMGPNSNPLGMAPLANSPLTFWTSVLNSSDAGKAALARAMYSGARLTPQTMGRVAGASMMIPSGQPPDSPLLANHPFRNGLLNTPAPSDPFLRAILLGE